MVKGDFQRRLLFLCATHTLLHIYTALPFALLPILINEYGLSIFAASIVVSIPGIFSLVFSIPSGLLADRLGYTKILSFSLFLQVFAGSLILLFPNLETVVLSFSLTALASTFYHPPALSATSNISPPEFLSRGLAFHGASGTFGISLGPITLGLVLFWLEWRYAYVIWIVPILAVAITAFLVKMDEPFHEDQTKSKGDTLTTPLKDVFSFTFLSFLLLVLFGSAASGTISTYITTFLTDSKGLDAGSASIIFGFSSLISLLSVVLGGYSGDKLGWKRSYTVIISVTTIALLCMSLSTFVFMAVLFYLVYAFFDIMTMPITGSLVAKIIPQKSRGTGYSVYFFPGNLIGIMIPIILGTLIDFYEIWIIFPIAIAFYIVVLIITQILKLQ